MADWNGILNFDMNDPKTAGLLNIGLGILAGNTGRPGDLGQGLLGGMQNYQQMMAQQQRQKLLEQQQQMQNTQFEWTKADREREQAQRDKQQELMGRLPQTLGINPDVLAAYPQIGQKLLEQQYMPQEIKAYKPGDVLYQGGKQIGAIPSAEDLNPNKPFLVVDGKIVPNKAFQEYEIAKAKAGSSTNNVSVNTGQKGFDNTLKLRSDFRSEPIYRAHQDVKSAYSQISTALKQNSPAGDLAGATKIMKILDPGSVVRESELGMAMAASGALDRLTNYADMVIRGTKLTPNQRKDFQTLADALYQESSTQYNAKRQEYQGIAERNGLDTMDVLGPEDRQVKKPKETQAVPMPAKPSPMTLKKGTVYQTPKGALRWNGKAFEDL
jgi:hypothetical protein